MKVSNAFAITADKPRINWSEVKDRIDIAAVATNLLGPAAKRQGARLLWPCPFHEDHDPSFVVNLTRKTWRCWACAIGGDAAELVMRANRCSFPDAVKFLTDLAGVVPSSREDQGPRSKTLVSRGPWTVDRGVIPSSKGMAVATPIVPRPPGKPPEQPTGSPTDEASTLVEESIRHLWGRGGRDALAYLHGRGLTDETIRGLKLGFTPCATISTKDGDRSLRFSGIVIPWLDGERLTRVKIRRIDDGRPKYAEAYSNRPLIYPDPAAIEPGMPLIIAEGEFDCVLLAQQIPEASVITLGSASSRTDPVVLARMLLSPRWFAAHDADQSGDSAASKFPARAVRVRPPGPGNDWTDVHAGGFNRIRYHWGRHLPLSQSWDQLEPKGA